jgi:Tetratricopeptide repeat
MKVPPDPKAILDATWELYSSPRWADARRIVEQHPELLSTHFPDQFLNTLIENSHKAKNEYDVNYFTTYRDLLRRAREVGIDAAFAELPSGPPPRSEAAAYVISRVPAELHDDLRRVMAADRRYKQGSAPEVLEEAADAWERIYRHLSLVGTEADFRWRLVNDGGVLYLQCFFSTGQDEHLDRALALLQEAVALTSPDSPGYAVSLHNLGRGLQAKYGRTATPDSLEEAIDAYGRAVAATSPDSPAYAMYCGGLGSGLKTRYTWVTGSQDDLDRAIQAYKLAVDYTAPHSANRSAVLNNWAMALQERYNSTGDLTDLDQSIEAVEQALAHPHSPSDSPGFSNNLGIGLLRRYDRTGAPKDLERAIESFKRAIADTPSGSPARSTFLSGLAAAWKTRYERTGKLDDLDEAIRVWEQALQHSQSRSPESARLLTSLGNGLVDRHARNGDLQDLKRAISLLGRAARQTSPDSPEFPTFMNNLGKGFLDFYGRTRDETFLEGAVQAFEHVVAHATPDASGYSGFMSNLGIAHWACYAATQQVKHLEAAIVSLEQAAELTLHDSPELPGRLNNLANALVSRHYRTGTEVDLAAAIDKFEQSAVRGMEVHPESTLMAARSWGKWAFARRAWDEAVKATAYGLKALEHLFATQLTRLHKETWLRDAQKISVQAAYALTMTDNTRAAAQALERGRALLLSEALQRNRADLERLKEAGRPDLQDRYETAVARWNRLSRATADLT